MRVAARRALREAGLSVVWAPEDRPRPGRLRWPRR